MDACIRYSKLDGLRGEADAVLRVPRHRRAASRAGATRCRRSRASTAAARSQWATQPEDRTRLWKARHDGLLRRAGARSPASRASPPTPACRSRGWPIASWRRKRRRRRERPRSRRSWVTSATATSISSCCSIRRAAERARKRRGAGQEREPARDRDGRHLHRRARHRHAQARRARGRSTARRVAPDAPHQAVALDPDNILNPGKTRAALAERPCTRSTSATRIIRRGRCAAGSLTRLSGIAVRRGARHARRPRSRRRHPRRLAVGPGARACTTATSSCGTRSRSPNISPSGTGHVARDPVARAWARCASAEMHSGFAALRNDMSMYMRERVDVRPWSARLARDIARICALWTRRRASASAQAATFLCGEFSHRRLLLPPVAFRFRRTASRSTARPAAYPRRCSRIRRCANGRPRRLPRRERHRRMTSRASSTDKLRSANRRGRSACRTLVADSGAIACARRPPRKTPLRIRRRRQQGILRRAACDGDVSTTGAYAASSTTTRPSSSSPRAAARRSARSRRRSRQANQMLAFEPPRFGADATLGGAVAAGLVRAAASVRRARCATSCSACAWSTARGEALRSAAA